MLHWSIVLVNGCASQSAIPFWQHIGAVMETNPGFDPLAANHRQCRMHVNVGTDSIAGSFFMAPHSCWKEKERIVSVFLAIVSHFTKNVNHPFPRISPQHEQTTMSNVELEQRSSTCFGRTTVHSLRHQSVSTIIKPTLGATSQKDRAYNGTKFVLTPSHFDLPSNWATVSQRMMEDASSRLEDMPSRKRQREASDPSSTD